MGFATLTSPRLTRSFIWVVITLVSLLGTILLIGSLFAGPLADACGERKYVAVDYSNRS